jgi:hypothetical protein
MDQYD